MPRLARFVALLSMALTAVACGTTGSTPAEELTFANASFAESALWRAETPADHRIRYGDGNGPLHYADLRLPAGTAPRGGFPVLVFIHGGAWRAEWSKDHAEAFAEALTAEGFATWDVEYRRLGHRGGGYPGTFEDIADAFDQLRTVAEEHPLNLDQVVAVGHSAGGHLALWAAGRPHIPASSPLHRDDPLPLRGVFSLAGVNDLELSVTLTDRKDVLELVGLESLDDDRERLATVDPGHMLPLGVPQRQYIGERDGGWRLEMNQRYAAKAEVAGDSVATIVVAGANHMDVVDARSGFAQVLARDARALLQSGDR